MGTGFTEEGGDENQLIQRVARRRRNSCCATSFRASGCSYALKKPISSSFTLSFSVVHIPWGAPL
jgi:hypothetical protein